MTSSSPSDATSSTISRLVEAQARARRDDGRPFGMFVVTDDEWDELAAFASRHVPHWRAGDPINAAGASIRRIGSTS